MIYGVKCIEFNLPDFTIGKHEIKYNKWSIYRCNNHFVRVNIRDGSKMAIPRGIEYSPGIWCPTVSTEKVLFYIGNNLSLRHNVSVGGSLV